MKKMCSALFAACIQLSLIAIVLVLALSPSHSADKSISKNPSHIELPLLQWNSSKRPDGTQRFWDPKPLIDFGCTSVCVFYRAQSRPNRIVYSAAVHPPKLLAETLKNCQPELKECHAHGIKVIGFQNTILFHPDMFSAEGIDTSDFYALDSRGKKILVKDWDKRGCYLSCLNNPKWFKLQLGVVQATADAGFDGLQFDLYPYAVEHGYMCHCHYCIDEWKRYSKKVTGTSLPMPDEVLDYSTSQDRLFREWRCRVLTDFLNKTEAHVQKKHPGFILALNQSVSNPDFAYLASHGAQKYPSTELWRAELGRDSSLFLYRMAEAIGGRKVIGMINSGKRQASQDYQYKVALAESYAGGGLFYFMKSSSTSVPFSRFLRENENWYVETKSAAKVGLLFSWRDLMFLQGAKTQLTDTQRVAAMLARNNVPYDCILTENGLTAKQLSRYKVIVTSNFKLLDDDAANALKKYVKDGGSLLAIGDLGMLKQVGYEYVKRDANLPSLWTGISSARPWSKTFGAGRLAWVPESCFIYPKSANEEELKLTPDLEKAAEYAGLFDQIKIKSSSQTEAAVRSRNNKISIHVIRFGSTQNLSDKSAQIDFQLPAGHHAASVTALSPDYTSEQISSEWKEENGRLLVDVRQFDNYLLLGVAIK